MMVSYILCLLTHISFVEMDITCMENGAHDSEVDVFGCQGDDADYESERNDEDLSETEISQIKLYDGIKRMVRSFFIFVITLITETIRFFL